LPVYSCFLEDAREIFAVERFPAPSDAHAEILALAYLYLDPLCRAAELWRGSAFIFRFDRVE